LLAIPIWPGDFKTGLEAYNRGDFAAALAEWQPIAEKGDPNAQYNMGLLYARGQGVTQDYTKAVEWYRLAAENGVAAAQYNLGVMFANGQGTAPNPEEARKWFLKAAEQGIGGAASNLGNIYYEGEGAFRDYSEAEKWYRKAAEQGVASAAFSLGVIHDLGQGVPQNFEEALKWYRKSADAGYAAALTNIGVLYYNGQGVKRDLPEAYAWLARAEKLGDPRAPQLIKWIVGNMKPGDIKKGQELAAQWKPPAQQPVQVADEKLFKQPQTVAGNASAPAPTSTAAAARAPSATPAAASRPNTWTGVPRVVAVGDVHGDYEQFVAVLQSAGVIDTHANWTGGKTHLVQTGDVTDRGPDSRAVMDLLIRLEKQAADAGGAVHALIGNHEAMDVYGDLRYVSPAEFVAFSGQSSADRSISYQDAARTLTAAATRDTSRTGPGPAGIPGFEEFRQAFGPNGEYGRWIRSHNAVIKIDRTLFAHSGLGAKYAALPLDRINEQVRAELTDLTRLHGGIVVDEQGPLWFDGLAKGNEAQLAPLVEALLKNFDVDRIVIGHSYADAAITPRFGGQVLLVDIGLPRVYDNVGKLGCLVIENGQAYALHRGRRLDLPTDDAGMVGYLKAAAALDPKPSPLEPRIKKLEGETARPSKP
jgi:TPR repeat protein